VGNLHHHQIQWTLEDPNAQDAEAIESQIWHEMAKSTDVLQTPLQPEGITAGRLKQQNIGERG